MKRVGLLLTAAVFVIATARADDTVDRIPDTWRAFAKTKNARLVRVLGLDKPLTTDPFVHFAVSPDGKHVAFGDKIIELATQKPVLQLTTPTDASHEDQLTKAILRAEGVRRFSPDGRRVVSCGIAQGGGDWPVAVATDLKARTELRFITTDVNAGGVYDVAFVQSTAVAVVGCSTGTLWVWATDGSKPPRNLAPDPEYAKNANKHRGVWSLDVAADGKRVLACAGPDLALWDLGTGKPRMLQKCGTWERPQLPPIFRAVFSKDGKDALSVDAKGAVKRWNLSSGEAKTLGELPANEGWNPLAGGVPCAFSRDRKVLVYSSSTNLSLFDLASGTVIDTIALGPLNEPLTGIVFGHNDRTIFVGTATSKKILQFEIVDLPK